MHERFKTVWLAEDGAEMQLVVLHRGITLTSLDVFQLSLGFIPFLCQSRALHRKQRKVRIRFQPWVYQIFK